MLSKLRFYDGIGIRPKRSANQTDVKDGKEGKLSKSNEPIEKPSETKTELKDANKKDKTIEAKQLTKEATKTENNDHPKQSVSENENKIEEKELNPDNDANGGEKNNLGLVKRPESIVADDSDDPDSDDHSKTCSIKSAKLSASGDPNKPDFSFKVL